MEHDEKPHHWRHAHQDGGQQSDQSEDEENGPRRRVGGMEAGIEIGQQRRSSSNGIFRSGENN
jgi:hypothetical protein